MLLHILLETSAAERLQAIDAELAELTSTKHHREYSDDYVPNLRIDKANDFAVGGKQFTTSAGIGAQENKELKSKGIDKLSMPKLSILYGYELAWGQKAVYGTTTTPEMDMIKSRGKYAGQEANVADKIDAGMNYFIGRLFSSNMLETSNRKRQSTSIKPAQDMIIDKSRPKIIIPMPSSSQLSSSIAKIVTRELVARGVDATYSACAFKQIPKVSWDMIKDDKTRAEIERHLASMKSPDDFSIKMYQQNPTLKHGRMFYDWIGIKPGSIPPDTDVIFVDDNVVSGQTMGDAAKAVYKSVGQVVNCAGLVLHRLRERDEEDGEDTSLTQQDKERLDRIRKLMIQRAAIEDAMMPHEDRQVAQPKPRAKRALDPTKTNLRDWLAQGYLSMAKWNAYKAQFPEPKRKVEKDGVTKTEQWKEWYKKTDGLLYQNMAVLARKGILPDLTNESALLQLITLLYLTE